MTVNSSNNNISSSSNSGQKLDSKAKTFNNNLMMSIMFGGNITDVLMSPFDTSTISEDMINNYFFGKHTKGSSKVDSKSTQPEIHASSKSSPSIWGSSNSQDGNNDDFFGILNGLFGGAKNLEPTKYVKNKSNGISDASSISISESGYSKKLGAELASVAESVADKRDSTGYCYRGVKEALTKVGINAPDGGSAYQAADQLSRKSEFKEFTVNREQLGNLPKGAIVVWDATPDHPHGHISIALGNGKEASDHIQNQMKNRNADYRVFLPVETKKA
jgi:hypothetical protein